VRIRDVEIGFNRRSAMTNHQHSVKADKPKSMIEADTANGERPEPEQSEATRRATRDGHPVVDRMGTK
jgi:hypothetical protein